MLLLLLLVAPAAAVGQEPRNGSHAPGLSIISPSHADHSGLHRLQPRDAAIEIIALGTIRPLDRDPAALCRAAELALVAALVSSSEAERGAWLDRAERYARDARELRPDAPGPMYAFAAALGVRARYLPLRDRIRTAGRLVALTDSILARDPDHPGGLHLRGRLSAEGAALSSMTRFLVERLIGGDLLERATWEEAEADFRRAIAAEPGDPAHRVALARVLHRTGRTEEARAELRKALAAPGHGALHRHHRQNAADLLAQLR